MENFHFPHSELKQIADIMRKGGVVIYPTDTIYGIGCDALSKNGVKRISNLKRREGKPFSFICRDIAQISRFAFISNRAFRLMSKILPGPYTIILEARKTSLPKKMIGKRNTVGIRIPDDEFCRRLTALIDEPIVTTSVNFSDEDPMLDPENIPKEISDGVDALVSIGPMYGEPSTVVDLTSDEPVVVRQGKGEVVW